MELRINPEPAEVMHIDLNSAFAMTEQQADPLLRGIPLGITNRINDYSICITSSYEARRLGITIGTRYKDARMIAPNFQMLESDAQKYLHIHRKMRAIFESYSPDAYMKSIDEGIIDFRHMRGLLKGRSLTDIGQEIKQRFRDEIGDYMSINVGIGQNLWLAKLAAGFMKPNGLYEINKDNLEVVYSLLSLTDLPYIASRNKIRLNDVGIYTPHELFSTSERVLTKQVFKSINGHHWYLKLRGYETEVQFGIKTVGRSYVLEHRTNDPEEMATLLYKACIKVSRRLRKNSLAARGFILQLGYEQPRNWQERATSDVPYGWRLRHMYQTAVHRSDELYARAMDLYNRSPKEFVISSLAMTAYAVEPARMDQARLWESYDSRQDRIEAAMNSVNDRYGELMLAPASVFKSRNPMKDKIPFGTIRYFN